MNSDRVQELGAYFRFESGGSFLDQAETQVDVPEEATLLGLPEYRRRAELTDAAEVMEQCCREQEVGA